MDFFDIKNVDIHNKSEQLEQQESLSCISINKTKSIATENIVEAGKKYKVSYHVSLNGCECEHFKKYKLPCRHMYSLAKTFGIYKNTKSFRSEDFIADFSNGYAKNWKFAVRKCNYDELDIRYTPRVIGKGKNKKTFYF